MSSETTIREEQAVAAPADVAPAAVLNKVLDNVRRDCRTDTQLYLEETTVPHGGE